MSGEPAVKLTLAVKMTETGRPGVPLLIRITGHANFRAPSAR